MARLNWDRTSDDELMRFAQNGVRDAFAELARRYMPRVRNKIGKNLWGDGATADDLTQDVFLKLWEKRASWRGDSKISTYIFAMVSNRCTDYFSNEKKKRGGPLSNGGAEISVSEPGYNRVDNRNLCEALSGMLDMMPERFRVPLVLFAYGGLTVKDIAALFGVTMRAVNRKLAIARKMLRERMGE